MVSGKTNETVDAFCVLQQLLLIINVVDKTHLSFSINLIKLLSKLDKQLKIYRYI